MKIEPTTDFLQSYRTGGLSNKLTAANISKKLGFKQNALGDKIKTTKQWDFRVDGKECSIWDYKGSKWSVYDPHKKLKDIFGDDLIEDGWQ